MFEIKACDSVTSHYCVVSHVTLSTSSKTRKVHSFRIKRRSIKGFLIAKPWKYFHLLLKKMKLWKKITFHFKHLPMLHLYLLYELTSNLRVKRKIGEYERFISKHAVKIHSLTGPKQNIKPSSTAVGMHWIPHPPKQKRNTNTNTYSISFRWLEHNLFLKKKKLLLMENVSISLKPHYA